MKGESEIKKDLSITTFNIDRYTTFESFLMEYRELGLHTLELNGRVPQFVIDELLPLIDRGEIHISSLHNFCPKPEWDEKDMQLSSLDETKRKTAVSQTMKTIETASRVGAKAVVVHAGMVEGLRELERSLFDLYRAGMKDSRDYQLLQWELREKRLHERMRYVQACEKSLMELSDFITRKNYSIKLGLENRYHYYELPSIDEYDEWFGKYSGAPLYFWYDFGHGEVLENLSLGNKKELFAKHGRRLLGLHIHDCKGVDDHLVPGMGEVDFGFVKEYLHPGIIKVLEYGRRFDTKEIIKGINFLIAMGFVS